MILRQYSGSRYYGWVHADFAPPSEVLEFPEKVSQMPGAECVLDCEGREISRISLLLDGQLTPCFVYFFKNNSWNRAFRRSYAFRTRQAANKLTQSQIGTLQILAALKKRGELLNWHSTIIAKEISGVQELEAAGTHIFHIHPISLFSETLALALAGELCKFHQNGFYHGDLKTRHILVSADGIPNPKFYFVDLEKCLHIPNCPPLIRDLLSARDLIQLFASLSSAGAELKKIFLDRYFELLQPGERRERRIRRFLSWYEPQGSLSQGKTLLSSLWQRLNTGLRP
ncbi:MAG: hypothetical protein HY645_08275 [Acidobacteria bacterium]|nr:hypothetical protein [Acidobacteriota bacterium]